MLRNMEYVYEVYKERSFTRAAKNLYVTQPCLSALVKKTEEKLGFPIFNRSAQSPAADRVRQGVHPLHRADAGAGK